MLENLFPEYPDPLEQTFWDCSNIIPVPSQKLVCRSCGSDKQLARSFFFRMKEGTIPWRCDVSFKCTNCACVSMHGVVVSEEIYNKAMELGSIKANREVTNYVIKWREAKAILLEQLKEKNNG
jgi:hypothetical protein